MKKKISVHDTMTIKSQDGTKKEVDSCALQPFSSHEMRDQDHFAKSM